MVAVPSAPLNPPARWVMSRWLGSALPAWTRWHGAHRMKIDGTRYRSVWVDLQDDWSVRIFDQTKLPWTVEILRLTDVGQVAQAIRTMQVRGAPLIGAVAAYGVCLALRADPSSDAMERDCAMLAETRPTAVNLRWAIERMLTVLRNTRASDRVRVAYLEAAAIVDEDEAQSRAIGQHGAELIAQVAEANGRRGTARRVNVLTHCNAGWLATVDWGTALAPVYTAFERGIDLHVWVDETRPRNQGAALTAFELGKHGVPHTVVADNAGGHLMQHGEVDLVIVGADRVTRTGDAANKIGTYLKALAAKDNGVPVWVALPSSTIDWDVSDGVRDIPIEERSGSEVTHMTGQAADGSVITIRVTPPGSLAANPAFDVTPGRLLTGLITERGRCSASEAGLLELFPERAVAAAGRTS